MNDDIKAAEKRAYANGYAAGRRRLAADRTRRNREAHKQAFIERALLVMPPVVFDNEFNWGRIENENHTLYKTVEERIDFALDVANTTWSRK